MSNASYWLPPHQEILPSTGCAPTGRTVTFHQLPKREWSCPNDYPQLNTHPEFGMYQWWAPKGMGTAEELRQYIRDMAPGIGASGWTGAILGVLGITAAIGGLAYYLMKRQKNPSSLKQAIMFEGLGSKTRSAREIYSRVLNTHPEATQDSVERTLEQLAREGLVRQSLRSGPSGIWKRSPGFMQGW